ncbi:hypothetical protein GPJ56_000982 [Histomonas meleagridis]|uniref:uncharacterized protein n=1 Tax=Histomonas meleagridis TaxID=135588 RepID=UPI00355AAF19|nr:hypothetical protein GPJ56_000982 [Histomonas meleagridis]KAH0803819.1 hypothetical protein GO595_002649 [Histomonas meleagridis]
MDKFDFGFLFTTIIGPPSIGLTIAGAYCIVAFGNDFDSTGLNMEIVFPCLYAYSMIMGSIYIFVSKPEEGVSYFQFIGAKFCSLSELTDKIAEVRAAPPIFQLNQTIGKGPSSLFKYVEYLTWEETESIISIPSKCPVCVAYKFYTEQSENIKNEVKEISSSNPGISFSSHVDVETPLLIAGNNITPIVKFMTRPFMKVVYIILVIFQYEFLLDLIFFSNCKLLVVKSYKRADVEPLFRTKAGEKDFEAATSMIQNEEAVDKNEDLL